MGKKAGQQYTAHRWADRFITQPNDRELLTRHEIQAHAPDLLVTNYPMREYMLLRPIERSIFSQTQTWLEADPRNQLLLILDEAHMYRGVGGAEVGFLIRRLMSCLGVGRERLRCILTSASLGSGEAAEHAVQQFARGLTGQRLERTFTLIRGTREARGGAHPGTASEAAALGTIDAEVLAAASIDSAPTPSVNLRTAHSVVASTAHALGWRNPPSLAEGDLKLRQYITQQLTGFGPLELLIELCAGNAMAFADLAGQLFPNQPQDEAERATDGLLAMGSFARRTEPGREAQPLLPTRVHILFRGLPPVYACLNSRCNFRRYQPGEQQLLGRLFTEPRTHCKCGARVFELIPIAIVAPRIFAYSERDRVRSFFGTRKAVP